MFLSRALCLPLIAFSAAAGVVRIHVVERTDVLSGRAQGRAGSYERIVAKAHFTIDPKLAANRIVADIDRAPLNEQGLVEFSADLYVLKPTDPARGNGTLLFEVSNRGRKGILSTFSRASGSLDPQTEAQFGDGFLLEQGFTLAWLGWQFDLPREPGLMGLTTLVAKGVTGLVRAEFVPDRKVLSQSLADRNHIPYAVARPDDPSLQLTVRDRTEGPRRVVPRPAWRFARDENGKPVDDRGSVYMAAGFEPGKLYELVYTAADPPLAGLGPAGVRELISFFKHESSGITLLGDQRRYIKRAIGFGTSQSGRFLRTFLYDGFNADEKGRRVFDGVWSHVPGASRGSFNLRFAQPSRDAHPFLNTFYPTVLYPFTDAEQTDPETGLNDGLLGRAVKAGVAPKIFYTNGSYEYWGRAASLIHTSLDGRTDVPAVKDTRIYLIAGAQHGAGSFPPARSNNTQHPGNTNDYRWTMRALLVAMNRWITDGAEPPASQVPLVGKDQLVAPAALSFPRIPGVAVPARIARGYRADYGPEFRSKGIATKEPPAVGKAFAALVPQVDRDGNEVSGIRGVDVRVPLGTLTGWNLRNPGIGAPDEIFSMAGSFFAFPRTKDERAKSGDPRLSLAERYKGREDYLEQVNRALADLVGQGHVLESDREAIAREAARRWDHLIAGN